MSTSLVTKSDESQYGEVEMGSLGAIPDSAAEKVEQPAAKLLPGEVISKKKKFMILLAIILFNTLNILSCVTAWSDYSDAEDSSCWDWARSTETCTFGPSTCQIEYNSNLRLTSEFDTCTDQSVNTSVTCFVQVWAVELGKEACDANAKRGITTIQTPLYSCLNDNNNYYGGSEYVEAVSDGFNFTCNSWKLVPLQRYITYTIYCVVGGVVLMLLTVVESYFHYNMNNVSAATYFWANMCTNTLALGVNGYLFYYIMTHTWYLGDYSTFAIFRAIAMVMILIEMVSFLLVSHGINHVIITFFTADYHKYFSGEKVDVDVDRG